MQFYEGEELRNLGLLPKMASQKYGSRTSLLFRDEELSFVQLDRRSSKLADSLLEEGLVSDDRVGLYIPNSLQFVESFFAVIKAGGVPVPLNLRMPPRTLSYILNDSNVDILISSPLETDTSNPSEAESLVDETGVEKLILPEKSDDKIIDYNQLIEEGSSTYSHSTQNYEDIAVQMYTSGTTGKPKGVLLSHKNVLSAVESVGTTMLVDSSTRMHLPVPLYHVYALSSLLCGICYGGSLYLQFEVDPGLMMENIGKFGCNIFIGVPAIFRMAWLVYQQEPEKYDLSGLNQVVCGGAPLDETTRKNIRQAWKVRFQEGWGMTENVTCGALNLGNTSKKAGCAGWPFPNVEIKLVDPETRETVVPWDEIGFWGELEDEHVDREGEIAIRGPVVFEGYYNMPEKNSEVFDDDGWFYTGDLGRIDEDKALWIVDRTDDMIIAGGENIYPSEVEDVLMEHPDISDAAVVPASHKTKGEAPVAFVTTSTETDLSEEEIKEFSLERVPTYAHPRRVFFKDSLPKSGSLKVQRFKLEEEAEEKISGKLGEV